MSALGDVLAGLDEIKASYMGLAYRGPFGDYEGPEGGPLSLGQWAEDEAEGLLAALEEARDLLREIEWGGMCADEGPHCPDCGGLKGEPGKHAFSFDGHAPDCALAIAIGAPRREK